MNGLLIPVSLALLVKPNVEVLYPSRVSVRSGDLVVLVRAVDRSKPWVEEPGRYITAVLFNQNSPKQEVTRVALHDGGEPPDASQADGIWSAVIKGLDLSPGEYLLNLAIEQGGGEGKLMVGSAAWLAVESKPEGAGTPIGLLVAVLLASLTAAAGAWLGLSRKGTATPRAPLPPGAWSDAISAAQRIEETVRSALAEWEQSKRWADSVAERLAFTLETIEQIEQTQGWKLGAVRQDIERALERMGWEQWSPQIGQPPPREAEQYATEEGCVEPGTVAAVVAPGWHRRRGESVEVLKKPVVAVRK